MGEHLVVYVDRLVRPPNAQAEAPMPAGGGSAAAEHSVAGPSKSMTESLCGDREIEGTGEDEPLIQTAECRICQEEDEIQNYEVPCGCNGSLKYAHRKCVQRWCDEKGDVTCEICHQPYQPGYTAPPPPPPPEDAIDIGGGWTISGTPLDLHDPRLLAITEADHEFLEAEYDDYTASNASGAAFCRSAALILMALLLLRHALTVPDPDTDDDDTSAVFSLFLLRAAGFLLPCYIMAWAIGILQRRRQRQEAAAALAATQVAFVLQAGQHRGLHFTIAPRPPLAIPDEAV